MVQKKNIPAIDEGSDWQISIIIRAVAYRLGIQDALNSSRSSSVLLDDIRVASQDVHVALERYRKSYESKMALIFPCLKVREGSYEFTATPLGYEEVCREMDISRLDLMQAVEKMLLNNELLC